MTEVEDKFLEELFIAFGNVYLITIAKSQESEVATDLKVVEKMMRLEAKDLVKAHVFADYMSKHAKDFTGFIEIILERKPLGAEMLGFVRREMAKRGLL